MERGGNEGGPSAPVIITLFPCFDPQEDLLYSNMYSKIIKKVKFYFKNQNRKTIYEKGKSKPASMLLVPFLLSSF